MVTAVSYQKEVGIQWDHDAQHLDALEQCHGSSFQGEASRKLIKEVGSDTKDEQDRLNIGIEINRNGRTYHTTQAESIYESARAIS